MAIKFDPRRHFPQLMLGILIFGTAGVAVGYALGRMIF